MNRNHMLVTRPIWTADCLKRASSYFPSSPSSIGYPKLLVSCMDHDWLDKSIVVDLNNRKVRQDLLQWVDWLEMQLNVDGVVCHGVELEDASFLLELTKQEASRRREISPPRIVSTTCPMTTWEESVTTTTTSSTLWKEPIVYSSADNQLVSIAMVHIELNMDENGRLAYDQSKATDQMVDFIQGNYALIDTVTRAILEAAVVFHEYWRLIDKEARLIGLLGRRSDRAITVLNVVDLLASTGVDTGGGGWIICKTQNFEFPPQHVLKGYAYLLTHPGIPCIHWASIHVLYGSIRV